MPAGCWRGRQGTENKLQSPSSYVSPALYPGLILTSWRSWEGLFSPRREENSHGMESNRIAISDSVPAVPCGSLVGKRHLARSAPLGAAPPVLLEWVWKIKLAGQGRLGTSQFHGWPGQAEFQWESAPGRAERGLYWDLTRQRIRVVLNIKGASISKGMAKIPFPNKHGNT